MSKKDPLHHDPVDVLGEAYEKLLERSLKQTREKGKQSAANMGKFIDSARDTAVELQEMTREEADKLADYLKRDLADAGSWLEKSSGELTDWLGFESRFMESSLFERFLSAADQTIVDLHDLQDRASRYHTGEVSGPGSLVCDQCGKVLHFHKPGRIPPCSGCHGTSFHRPVE